MSAQPQPGWYPDPGGSGQRYFDGQNWGPPAPPPKKSSPLRTILIIVGICFAVLVGCGVACDSMLSSNKKPAASDSSSVMSSPSSIFIPRPSAPPTPLKPADFTVNIIVTEQKCFGSAGCVYRYTIDPSYIGTQARPGAATVIYTVKGGDEDQVGNFRIDDDGTAHFDREESIQGQSGAVLAAEVTQVVER